MLKRMRDSHRERRRTTLLLDAAKLAEVISITGAASASEAVDNALQALIRQTQGERHAAGYQAIPAAKADEWGAWPAFVQPPPSDDEDWDDADFLYDDETADRATESKR